MGGRGQGPPRERTTAKAERSEAVYTLEAWRGSP